MIYYLSEVNSNTVVKCYGPYLSAKEMIEAKRNINKMSESYYLVSETKKEIGKCIQCNTSFTGQSSFEKVKRLRLLVSLSITKLLSMQGRTG